LRPCTGQESARVELATGRRAENLVLALSHDHPYDPGLVRSVRPWSAKPRALLGLHSLGGGGPGKGHLRPHLRRGPGIIHPLAVACGAGSARLGPASRAEEFLHLEDSKARGPRARPGAPRFRQGPGLPAERARVRGASCTPARGGRVQVQEGRQAGLQPGGAPCCRLPEQAKVSSAVIGDPSGVRDRDAGAVQNRRTHRWLVVHTTRALCYRWRRSASPPSSPRREAPPRTAPIAGPWPKSVAGSWFAPAPLVAPVHHRDVAGAQNMVRKLGVHRV